MTEKELNLLHCYLDGTITPEEMESLEDLLRSSKEARSTLRSLAAIDTKWEELAAGISVDPTYPEKRGEASKVSQTSRFAMQPWLTLGAITLALIVGVFGWVYNRGNIEGGIARVIRIEGTDSKFSDDAELQSGDRIEIREGLIEMAFHETGVHVVATAPLSLRIESAKRIFLYEGEVKLHVPPQGIGFVVDTLDRQITDLGTSFVVTTKDDGSRVLVLDGQITVANRDGSEERLMSEGDLANFEKSGEMEMRSRKPAGAPELSLPSMQLTPRSLPGIVFGFDPSAEFPQRTRNQDLIGARIMPLIKSGFQDRACLKGMKQGLPLRFTGIAGTYNQFPIHTGLEPYHHNYGWVAWYQGEVTPPQPGRYRFWGYADNQLLVAINGKPVFEGSRYNSAFHSDLNVPRHNHPALPCLNAVAGFASGPWIEVEDEPVQLDLLFGETGGKLTSAVLLVEREGSAYEKTFWGQPKWSLFLTEAPTELEKTEFNKLRRHMEEKLMGSFSISPDAIWKVAQ